jgi:hypothetical protein
VGHVEELVVVVVVDELVQLLEHLVEPPRLLDRVQPEGGLALQGHRRHDAHGPHAHPGGREHLGLLVGRALEDRAVARHQPEAPHLRRQRPEVASGPVGRRVDGAGHRLVGDVAQVLQGQALDGQRLAQAGQGDARLHRDPAGGPVDVEHPLHAVQRQVQPVGQGRPGERVAGAVGLDPLALGRRPLDEGGQLVLVGRRPDRRGGTAGRPRPVGPTGT